MHPTASRRKRATPLYGPKADVRIAILTTSYPRAPGDPSGHFVEAEAAQLACEGHDVHVIAPGPPRRRPGDRGSFTVWGAGAETLFGFPGALARARQRPLR